VCGYENGEAWRSEQSCNELPRRSRGPRASHDSRMGCHPQKLIDYSPGGVPGIRPRPLSLKPVATGGVKLPVSIGGINQHLNQHIGINREH